MSYNLPPGCRVSDLPGNSYIDEAFEAFMDTEAFEAACNEGDEDHVYATFRQWLATINEPQE